MNAHAATYRILVIANERVDADVLAQEIDGSVAPGAPTQVLVVAPALNGRYRRWTSDDDEAYEAAEERLRSYIDDLERRGYDVNGMIGDADPLLAIAQTLQVFRADLLVIATHPESRANWLARNLVARARERFDLPIISIVTDEMEQRPLQDASVLAA
jgi:ribosomal protein S18 acetylase RimI-like enzyme